MSWARKDRKRKGPTARVHPRHRHWSKGTIRCGIVGEQLDWPIYGSDLSEYISHMHELYVDLVRKMGLPTELVFGPINNKPTKETL